VNLLYLKMCKEIWETAVGENFVCARGPLCSHDCSSCMWKEKELPRMLSRPCSNIHVYQNQHHSSLVWSRPTPPAI